MLIVTGSDDNYISGVMVLIASAAYHNPEAEFAVLGMDVSETNRDRLWRLSERLNVPIRFIAINASHFEKYPVRSRRVTSAAFLRWLIPELFPDQGRAIYMDCDMVVMGSLDHLETVDLTGKPLAAVVDPTPPLNELIAVQIAPGRYFNSGLLVINIPEWKRLGISQKCASLVMDESLKFMFVDQSALNLACKDNVILLPIKFNVFSALSSYIESIFEMPQEPVVIHFVVNTKPWKALSEFGEVWHCHADRIQDLLPPRPPMDRKNLSVRSEVYTKGFHRPYFIPPPPPLAPGTETTGQVRDRRALCRRVGSAGQEEGHNMTEAANDLILEHLKRRLDPAA